MKMNLITVITTAMLWVLLIVSLTGNACATDVILNSGIDARELADELTDDGWVLYGTDQCPWCVRQAEEFVDAFGNLTYINCMENRTVCIDAGIEGIPCWASPNGTLHPGYHNLTRLSGLVGDYRAAHPAPAESQITPETSMSTSPSTPGFEPLSALIAVAIVFLMRRR